MIFISEKKKSKAFKPCKRLVISFWQFLSISYNAGVTLWKIYNLSYDLEKDDSLAFLHKRPQFTSKTFKVFSFNGDGCKVLKWEKVKWLKMGQGKFISFMKLFLMTSREGS